MPATDLLSPETVKHLVGVIDLKAGQAVHAIAGRRSLYKPVSFPVRFTDGQSAGSPTAGSPNPGDPIALANHYRQLGIQRLYVADLDALGGGGLQHQTLDRLIGQDRQWSEILIDVGWRSHDSPTTTNFIRTIAANRSHVKVIAATESAQQARSLQQLAELISPQRILLGLDYRDEVFISDAGTEAAWIATAQSLGIASAVVLDVSTVGTGVASAATRLCRRISHQHSGLTLYSGGGIRSAGDVETLREAGCTFCLAATSLHY